MSMKLVHLYVTKNQLATLKALSKKSDLSYAELVRRAIDEYLTRLPKKASRKS